MVYYNSYYVDGCENKKISHFFMRVILAYSDAFSFIYFRYNEKEKLSRRASLIKKRLSPFELDSRDVTEWPGTKILNERNHIYRMVTYRVDFDVLPILEKVNTLWDWDYPKFPMDPCFYKKGYAWFVVTTHEHCNVLYMREDADFPIVDDLESLGVSLIPEKKVSASELFYNSYYSCDNGK